MLKQSDRRSRLTTLFAIWIATASILLFNHRRIQNEVEVFHSHNFFRVEIRLESDVENPIAQLFYDVGKNFNPKHSVSIAVGPQDGYQTLYFQVPLRKLSKLRFDPINGSGRIWLRKPTIVNADHETISALDFDMATPAYDISVFERMNQSLYIQTKSKAIDPQIFFSLPSAFFDEYHARYHRFIASLVLRYTLMVLFPMSLAFLLARHNRQRSSEGVPRLSFSDGRAYRRFSNRYVLFFFSIALYVVALFLRSGDILLEPGFYMEDTLHYFNLYYGGSQSIAFVFHRPHEYYNILNNFAAWCISQIDVCLQGYAYRIFSVGLSVVTSACLVFTNLYVTPVIILLIPLVLGLSGMNHLLYYATITFQMYVVVVLLLCLMFFKAPRSRFLFYLAGAVCLLLVWSGPFSVVALPAAFLFLLLFNEKRKNLLLVWLLFCVLIYTSTSQGLVQIGNLFDIRVVSKYCTVMIDKVLLFQLFDRGNLYIALIVAASLSLCVFHLRNERNYLKYSVIFLSIVLLGPVPLFLSVRIARFPEPYPCHLLISQFFWLAWLLFTADTLIRKHWRNRELWILLPIAFMALVTVDNFLHPEKRTLPLLPETQAFLCAVSNAEKLQLEKKDRYVVLSYGKGKFTAIARVGSHGNGAERLGKDGIADASIRIFVRE